MARKIKGQRFQNGELELFYDVDAYHKDKDSFDLTIDPTNGLIYLTINGQKVGQGVDVGGGGGKTRYNISKILTKASLANSSDVIVEGATYVSLVVPANGYEVKTVSVTMGGTAVANVFNEQTQTITVANVRSDLVITVVAQLKRVDMLDITWANHAITCGQNTNNYNAWSPHNLQYDDVNDCFVFLQCHSSKHIDGTYLSWTLSIIDPYDPTYCVDVNIPPLNTLGMLWIENGVWWVFARWSNLIYKTANMGQSWETITPTITLPRLFGIYKAGGKYFAGNDSNTERTYFVSDDLINWQTKSFADFGYDVLCETTFCDFQGKIWAFNRTNDEELGHPVILNSSDGGETWTVFSDQLLHGWRSTVSCLPFDSYIAIADIARNEGYVYYSIFDGDTVTELKEWKVMNVGTGDDLHNVNLATNYKDAVIVEFMHPSPCDPYAKWSHSDYACDNVMIVGGTRQLPQISFYGDAIYTKADAVAYANEHFAEGTNGVALTGWSAPSAVQCNQSTDRTFFTEIELPLNLVPWYSYQMGSSWYGFPSGNLYNGKYALKYCNNPNNAHSSNYFYSADPCVELDGVKYFVFNIPKSDTSKALIVVLKMPRFTNVTVGAGTNTNALTGETWQESLGFRRVLPVNQNKNMDWRLISDAAFRYKPADTPLIRFVRYDPAPPAGEEVTA